MNDPVKAAQLISETLDKAGSPLTTKQEMLLIGALAGLMMPAPRETDSLATLIRRQVEPK